MLGNNDWYVVRYKSCWPWQRYAVVRWVDGSRFEWAERNGKRGFWFTRRWAELVAESLNWEDWAQREHWT